ncbi:MAG: glycosyltransferase family 2 protein [Gemmobacter sp.]
MRAVAVLAAKDEGAFLLDWAAHARAAGFSDLLIVTNDCTDGTDAMAERLAAIGVAAHLRNPGPHPKGPQWHALALAERHPAVRGAEWCMVHDIDEFLCVKVGDGTVAALLGAVPGADAVAVTWRMFGNGGIAAYEDRPVVEQFRRAAPVAYAWPWRAQLVKTLFRVGLWDRLGVHRPRRPVAGRAAVWLDGSGRRLSGAWAQSRIIAEPGQDTTALVQLNHYALGAMESYIVKCARGRANREAAGLDMGYWVERNLCAVEDGAADRLAAPRAAVRAELGADPVLARLHAGAVAWRRARFAALMREEPWRALYGRLMMTPPSRVLSAAEAAAIRAHAGRG